LIVTLGIAGVIKLDPVALAKGTSALLVGIAILFFATVLLFGGLDKGEKQRVGVIFILCAAGALFWAGFEQAGSSFNLFAERYTQRKLGFEIPASLFQSVGPIFVITLAPVMAALWVSLARRNLNPSLPMKFGLG